MIALTWALPEARPPLKLGQKSQRKMVPGGEREDTPYTMQLLRETLKVILLNSVEELTDAPLSNTPH